MSKAVDAGVAALMRLADFEQRMKANLKKRAAEVKVKYARALRLDDEDLLAKVRIAAEDVAMNGRDIAAVIITQRAEIRAAIAITEERERLAAIDNA